MKDADDRWLEALFATPPVADDGFSERVTRRIRRRLQVRRWCLPAAVLVGGSVALQPTLALLGFATALLKEVPGNLFGTAFEALPSTTLIVGGGVLFALAALAVRLLEE